MTQMGFFDLSDRYASLDAKNDPLIEIDSAVEWEEFRATLERVWRKPEVARESRAGRKPLDALLMFKTLVLAGRALQPFGRPDRVSSPRPSVFLCASSGRGSGSGRQDGLALSRSIGSGGNGRDIVQAV
jgi:hypothetical protein